MSERSAEGDAARAVMWGLTSLDDEIRKEPRGVPGSGVYALLDMLAGQFLGVPRGAYPTAPPPVDPPATQVADRVAAGKPSSMRRISRRLMPCPC